MKTPLSVAALFFALCLMSTVGAVAAEEPQPAQNAPQPEAQPTIAQEVLEDAAAQISSCRTAPPPTTDQGWNPATCGRCQGLCTSDDKCGGRLAGDICSNDGKTCVAFNGCALFNCCRCQ
jgi:hypothetical protein